MIPKDEIRKGLALRLARKESGLHQADVASMLRPPIDVHIVAAWEQGLSQPTESQRIQLQAMFRRRLPKSLQIVDPKRSKFDRSSPWNRGLGVAEFAAALKSAQRELGVPTIRQLAMLLHVPNKTITAAAREELPTHVKFVVATVLGWEGRAGSLYGLLSATQRRKVDQIARGLARKELYEVRELSEQLPGTTRRRLEGLNYEWQKADRLRKRMERGGGKARSQQPARPRAVVIELSSKKLPRAVQAGSKTARRASVKSAARRALAGGR